MNNRKARAVICEKQHCKPITHMLIINKHVDKRHSDKKMSKWMITQNSIVYYLLHDYDFHQLINTND